MADIRLSWREWTIRGAWGVRSFITTSSNIVCQKNPYAYFNGGKTYTFETVGNYSQVQINVAAFSVSGSFDLNYKIEQGGKVIADESLTISEDGNAYTQPYVLK